MPGALAVMVSLYAAIGATDALNNERTLAKAGKLTLAVLGISGAASIGDGIGPLMAEMAENTATQVIAESGHYLMEEQPAAVAAAVRAFVAGLTSGR